MYAMRNPSHACGVDLIIGIVFLHIMRSFYFSSISSFKSLLHYNAIAPVEFPRSLGCECSNAAFERHYNLFSLLPGTLWRVVVFRMTILCSDLGLFLTSCSFTPIDLCCLQKIIGVSHEYYLSVRSLRPSSEGHKCS